MLIFSAWGLLLLTGGSLIIFVLLLLDIDKLEWLVTKKCGRTRLRDQFRNSAPDLKIHSWTKDELDELVEEHGDSDDDGSEWTIKQTYRRIQEVAKTAPEKKLKHRLLLK